MNELKVRLYEEELDIDGSREMLVARLKAGDNARRTGGGEEE